MTGPTISASNAIAPSETAPERPITLAELLPMMQAAAERMSAKNPARRVIWIAGQVIVQLAKEVAVLQQEKDERESRIVLP